MYCKQEPDEAHTNGHVNLEIKDFLEPRGDRVTVILD